MLKAILLVLLLTATQTHRNHDLIITLVTGLWKPTTPQDAGAIPYDKQLLLLDTLMKTDENMIIFGDQDLMKRVTATRKKQNTVFVLIKAEELNQFYPAKAVRAHLQSLQQTNPTLLQKYSKTPQFSSAEYASLMFSKPALLHRAISYDIFTSDYLYWIEPDIHNNNDYNYHALDTFSSKRNLLRKFSKHFQLPFIVRSINVTNLGQGFEDLSGYVEEENIENFAMAEWFGGRIEAISTVYALYEELLRTSLHRGDYWSHETLFTILMYRYPKIVCELGGIMPREFYLFDINNFRDRPIQDYRHVSVLQGNNGSIRIRTVRESPPPIFTTKVTAYENYYQFELLTKSFKFRADRSRLFLSFLIFVYVLIRVLKRVQWPKKGPLPIVDQQASHS